MNKIYNRINWKNAPVQDTPLNDSNLNKIDDAVNKLDDRIVSLDNEITTLNGYSAQASESASESQSYAKLAQSYATGSQTLSAPGGASDNAKWYYQETKKMYNAISAGVLKAFPIGSIYLSLNATDPSSFIGGTWQQVAEGSALISAGSTYKANSTYGSNTHTLTVGEMPAHKHGFYMGYGEWVSGKHDALIYTQAQNQHGENPNATYLQQNAGGGQPHSVMQQSLAVYVFKRIA